jgi:hypothetical protein
VSLKLSVPALHIKGCQKIINSNKALRCAGELARNLNIELFDLCRATFKIQKWWRVSHSHVVKEYQQVQMECFDIMSVNDNDDDDDVPQRVKDVKQI